MRFTITEADLLLKIHSDLLNSEYRIGHSGKQTQASYL